LLQRTRRKNRIALAGVFKHKRFAMLARVLSAAVNGIEAFPVEVEANSGWGDTIVVIIGLPDAAVKESRAHMATGPLEIRFKYPSSVAASCQ
jgi:hypothetical protein